MTAGDSNGTYGGTADVHGGDAGNPSQQSLSAQGGAPAPAPAEEATRLYLEGVKQSIEQSANDAKSESAQLRNRETIVFACYVITGLLSAVIAVIGFILIARGLSTEAAIAEIVGVVGGAGSAGFRRAATITQKSRERLGEREDLDRSILNAIGVTLMIPDAQERTAAMADLAGRLAERVGPRPRSRGSQR